MTNYIATFKFYNRKGQRYSIFGVYDRDRQGLNVYIIKCSFNDTFKRKEAVAKFKAFYLGEDIIEPANPEEAFIFCKENESMTALMSFCNANYYRLKRTRMFGTNIGIEIPALIREADVNVIPEAIILPSKIKRCKTQPYPVETEE